MPWPASKHFPAKACLFAGAVSGALLSGGSAQADESDAVELLQAMSDYLAAQQSVSFDYEADLEVVTTEMQKLAFPSAGTVRLQRPDKIQVTRTGGYFDVKLVYDGKELSVLDRVDNVYTQIPVAGSIDELVDTLRWEHGMHAPGADLLFSDVYAQLMPHVTDVKDLGFGIVGGVECDHLAFRTDDVDWQIWIAAEGDPHPCRYVITSKLMVQAPQYRLDITNWKTDDAAVPDTFKFATPDSAERVDADEFVYVEDVPDLTALGGEQ